MESPTINRGSQVGESCERENTSSILEFVSEELLSQIPAGARERIASIDLSISCGGIALEGSGCQKECVPFIVGQFFDGERQLGEFMYAGNCIRERQAFND